MSLLNPHLAAVLICPLCHGALKEQEAEAQLCCQSCGRTYPVRDFPIMMPEAVTENAETSADEANATLSASN